MVMTIRESARAYVRLPVTITAGGRTWSGRTRDLSRGGTLVFVEAPYPLGSCELTVELPTGAFTALAEVRFTIPGVGVGLQFANLSPADLQRLAGVVETAAATFGLWGLVGKYLTDVDTRAPLKLATNQESVFAELRASLHKTQAQAVTAELGHFVLHPVGENGAAYKILFTRTGCVPAPESELMRTHSGFARASRGKVARVAPQDVWLKLHAGSHAKPYRLVELVGGGYGAIVVSEVPGAPPWLGFLTLGMGEQVALSNKGVLLFPAFTDAELEEIRLDSVRRNPTVDSQLPQEPAVTRELIRTRFTDFVPFDETRELELTSILKRDAQAEERKYGPRAVTLHPHILMRMRDGAGMEHVGVPLHDGKRYCLLQLTPDGFGKVMPMGRDAQFSLVVR